MATEIFTQDLSELTQSKGLTNGSLLWCFGTIGPHAERLELQDNDNLEKLHFRRDEKLTFHLVNIPSLSFSLHPTTYFFWVLILPKKGIKYPESFRQKNSLDRDRENGHATSRFTERLMLPTRNLVATSTSPLGETQENLILAAKISMAHYNGMGRHIRRLGWSVLPRGTHRF